MTKEETTFEKKAKSILLSLISISVIIFYFYAKSENLFEGYEDSTGPIYLILIGFIGIFYSYSIFPKNSTEKTPKDDIEENEKIQMNKEEINNQYIWIVVLTPFIGGFVELLLEQDFALIYFLLNVIFCVLDEKLLKSKGYQTPNSLWLIFIPVYLWKRANTLKQNKVHFWGWIAAIIISIMITIGVNNTALEESALPVVNQILQANLGAGSAKCIKVTITEEVTDSFFKAIASLNNGNELKINIEKKENQIYVTIPNNQ